MKLFTTYLLLASTLLVQSCFKKHEYYRMLDDAEAIKILDLQDHRNTAELIPFLKAKKTIHRTLAAYAFASIRDTVALPWLYLTLLSEKDTSPRRAAAYAIGQTGDSSSVEKLISGFIAETSVNNQQVILEAIGKCGGQKAVVFLRDFNPHDTRLQLARLKGMYRLALKKQYDHAFTPILAANLKDTNNDIQLASLQTLQRAKWQPQIDEILQLVSLTKSTNTELARLALKMSGVNKQFPEPNHGFGDFFLSQYTTATNAYAKAELIKKLKSGNSDILAFLNEQCSDTTPACLRTQAAQSFFELSKPIKNTNKEIIQQFALKCIASGDAALLSLVSTAMQDSIATVSENNLLTRLAIAKTKLLLPRDMETLADIDKTLAHFTGEKFVKPKPPYNHAPDWKKIAALPDTVKIKLTTNKGIIIMNFLTDKAPCSVYNITKLVDEGFYNGKFFHRVVPDFVIQGGCPRGDGWGALNWTQRSEFSNELKYTRGTVGLASSGEDTEGVQFFITHCATPHLEGRYTIIGYVTDGMETVDKIAVGDSMIKMERLNR